jgi:uncharacterized damage-inducible protein DinB
MWQHARVTSPLVDPLAHNSWATRQLIGFCRDTLSPEQLQATTEGTYGTILATLQHVVGAEGRYRLRLAGRGPDWPAKPEDTPDLDRLERMNDEMAGWWQELAATEFDPDRRIDVTNPAFGDPFEVTAGMLVAQSINHGNEHRAQVFTILTTIGIEPPELDGWAWGEATGRLVMKPAS